jgi:hypothetical protein
MIAEALAAVALVAPAPAQVPAPPEESLRCMDKRRCRGRVIRKRRRAVVAPYDAALERVAECESGPGEPDWHVNQGDGYFGGLQFDLRTWRSVGGSGLPSAASELEQKYRAVLLVKRRGWQPWPVCGAHA